MIIDFDHFPYPTMRQGQKDALEKIDNHCKNLRYIVLEVAPGGGKSGIAKTIIESFGSSYILTSTKQLQEQYSNEFNNISLIKGKRNYTCTFNNATCDFGACSVDKEQLVHCMKSKLCPYFVARDRSANSKHSVMSYAYFFRIMPRILHQKDIWEKRKVLVIDECHLLESHLTDWAAFKLMPTELDDEYNIFNSVELKDFIVISALPDNPGLEENKIWFKRVFDAISVRLHEIQTELSSKQESDLNENDLYELNNSYIKLSELCKKMRIFIDDAFINPDNWLIEPIENGLSIQPIITGDLFKQYLDKCGIEKVIFMSGTIFNIKSFCEELNIEKKDVGIIRVPSEFDPQRSPIVFDAAGKMSYAELDNTIPNIITNTERILEENKGNKGIIHCANYKIAQAIWKGISKKYKSRLLMKIPTESNEDLLYRHKKSKLDTVLISPSLHTGIDLKDDLSRFQIIVKLPFMSLADKRTQLKIAKFKDWYSMEMLKTFWQSCFRSTRTENDYSITYVFDASFYYWINKYKNYIPQQYLKRIIWNKDNFDSNTFFKNMEQ